MIDMLDGLTLIFSLGVIVVIMAMAMYAGWANNKDERGLLYMAHGFFWIGLTYFLLCFTDQSINVIETITFIIQMHGTVLLGVGAYMFIHNKPVISYKRPWLISVIVIIGVDYLAGNDVIELINVSVAFSTLLSFIIGYWCISQNTHKLREYYVAGGLWILRGFGLVAGLSYFMLNGVESVDNLVGDSVLKGATLAMMLLTAFAGTSMIIMIGAKKTFVLTREANIDKLTGIPNRRMYERQSDHTFEQFNLSKMYLCVAILDIDHFKHVNDIYGHDIGDEVLKHVATVARESTREEDILCRFGGEEFVIIMHNCPATAAANTAERIRKAIETSHYVGNDLDIPVTVSIGISSARCADKTFDVITKRADEALYEAKDAGRNNVKMYV